MKTIAKIRVTGLLIFFIGALNFGYAQSTDYTLSNQETNLKVYGTSSLHDWHMDSEQQSGSLKFEDVNTSKISGLTIEIQAEGLKSGKSGMDKNAYKAINTKKYKTINFKLNKVVNVKDLGANKFQIKSLGDLTIAGVTKQINLDFTTQISGSKVIVEGEYQFKMTQFKVDPPTAMMGAIKTGDDLTIKFKTVYKK
ncbi:YceI family protein [Gaetbulibacter saemankumensis]|uniref:YceI family protein n=1 Tax=Gaetbulibacter saemankumensis TaxID=311208 RepID=UPI00041B7D42|nr:YceI family protein [Gaetbulibacter saemankumensis]